MKPGLRFLLGIAFVTLGLDILSKHLVQVLLPPGRPVPVFPGFDLDYVLNSGAAFSLLTNLPSWARLPFFSAVTLAALVAVAVFWRSQAGRDRWMELALGLIAGGAVGNLVDRARMGYVVDFLEFGVRGFFTWPVFNLADSAVCVGVTILAWKTLAKGAEK